MERQILNKEFLILGAGDKINLNAINHDRIKYRPEIDVVWDLDDLPWPFDNNQFIFIEARAVLEHLQIGLLLSINECWRILKPEGSLYVKLPLWNSERTWDDPTHIRGFTINTMDYFDPDTKRGKQYHFYTKFKWKILEKNQTKTAVHFKLQVRK